MNFKLFHETLLLFLEPDDCCFKFTIHYGLVDELSLDILILVIY